MVIRLGRNGRFLACSLYPEHKESRPLPGDEPPAAGGNRRGLPEVRRGHARRQARPVRPVRRLLALPGLRLHQEGRPAAAGSAAVRGHLPQEQGRPPRPASRPADGQRLLGLLELPALRLHDEPRAARRPARHRRRPAGAQGRGGDLPHLRLDERRRRPTASSRASATPGGPPNPEALARPARARGGPRAGGASKPGGRRTWRRPVGWTHHHATDTTGRAGRGRVSGAPAGDAIRSRAGAVPPLPRRPRRLTAHPARVRHRRRRLSRLAG